jgi:hypothetical protein
MPESSALFVDVSFTVLLRWKIIYNCELNSLLFGSCNEHIFHSQLFNRERVDKFSFSNMLSDITPLLSDKWLKENDLHINKALETQILGTV